MAFALILIFLLVVIFSIIPEFLPSLSRKVVNLVVQESDADAKLKEEYIQVNQEMKDIRMVDEFAKYARAERKLNKLKAELTKQKKSNSDVFLKMKLGINAVFHVAQLVCFLGIIYTYRSIALLKMPPDWLYPINFVVSFPTGISGAVSVTFWLLVCRTVVRKGLELTGRSC